MLTWRYLCAAAVLGVGAAMMVTNADRRGGGMSGRALAQAADPQPVVVAPPTAEGRGGAVRVTTDTPEYCERLAQRVARDEKARPDVPLQAAKLAEEGHRMCATGLIRGGLVRLRRAWLMLRGDKRTAGAQ